MNLSETQVEQWRLLHEEHQAGAQEVARHEERDRRRLVVQKEMLALLQGFLTGRVELESFKTTFDGKTRKEWDVFGLKGMSGAMFLNTLVKHIPDQEAVKEQLKVVLPAPTGRQEAEAQMRAFHEFLSAHIEDGRVTKRQVQPVRMPFFVSAWWHVQETESWPAFYFSGRRALAQEGMYQDSGDSVADYFAFRDRFLELAQALDLSSWELEHLLDWYHHKGKREEVVEPSTPGGVSDDDEEGEDSETMEEGSSHSHVQWLLARIGRKLGCKVWIASNDHKREWNGQPLGEFSMKDLPPLGLDEETQRTVRLIDVIWIQGKKQIAAAFEVEHTTSIYSGLLRMADLVALAPNLSFPLYIVAPESRLDKVRRELSRPTFQALNLHEQCGYFSSEELAKQADMIMQWASSPEAIDRLATRVGVGGKG